MELSGLSAPGNATTRPGLKTPGSPENSLEKSAAASGAFGKFPPTVDDVIIVAHYFTLKVSPSNYVLGFSPLPSMKPNKKLKFRIAEQRHELPA